MVRYAWLLHHGKDFTEQNYPYIDSEELWSVHRLYKWHIHEKHVDLAACGCSYLLQKLDPADKVLWPEEGFGKAKSNNMEPMVAIMVHNMEWNAEQGAQQGVPENGIGTQAYNRGAQAPNDVGWEVHS